MPIQIHGSRLNTRLDNLSATWTILAQVIMLIVIVTNTPYALSTAVDET